MVSKLEKYNQAYKKALGTVIYKLIPDIGSFSVTDVLIDPSLLHGRVWLKTNAETMQRIENKRADIQQLLTRYVKARYTPKLTFIADDSYLEHLDELFDEAKQ